ncbi:checkpoint HUS1 isoform X5, partial [Clarias magur]
IDMSKRLTRDERIEIVLISGERSNGVIAADFNARPYETTHSQFGHVRVLRPILRKSTNPHEVVHLIRDCSPSEVIVLPLAFLGMGYVAPDDLKQCLLTLHCVIGWMI